MSSLAEDTQWVDAVDQAELVRSGKVTPVELLDAAIERAEQLNPAINALTFTWFDKAREIARSLPANSAMPLRGVPFILKDLHAAMKGFPLSNGNKAMKAAALNSEYTAEIVQRFMNAGLVIFGRGNSPEFGSVPTTEPEAWGPTRNPWDTNRMAGGSSGGSAAAVAAGIVPAAHATDGGGSVRIPAACCGLVGLKVSQGRITAAPFRDETNLGVEHVVSRTVRDTALLLDIVEGALWRDADIRIGTPDWLQGNTLSIIGVAIPSEFMLMVPYIATIIAVTGLVGRVRAPAADGIPYRRGGAH